jgi:hypothetical protein
MPALPVQAFVKARGDGLGFDLSKAEFHFDADNTTASVWLDGQPQPRFESCTTILAFDHPALTHGLHVSLPSLCRQVIPWPVLH